MLRSQWRVTVLVGVLALGVAVGLASERSLGGGLRVLTAAEMAGRVGGSWFKEECKNTDIWCPAELCNMADCPVAGVQCQTICKDMFISDTCTKVTFFIYCGQNDPHVCMARTCTCSANKLCTNDGEEVWMLRCSRTTVPDC